MESGTRDSLATEKISEACSSLGEAYEILGRVFNAGNFTILGQEQFVVIEDNKICRIGSKISRKIYFILT
jgi:hypothetical protein